MERLSVETPERVALEYELAGLGSRFAAAVVDGLVQAALLALLLGGLALVGSLSCEPLLVAMDRHSRGEPEAFAALQTGRFLVLVAGSLAAVQVVYHTLFEGLRDGQTPGKRLLGVRVVREGGLPVRLGAALIRNLLRPLDFLPVFFGLGAVLTLVTARAQRLGDLAARTFVVRERAAAVAPLVAPQEASPELPPPGPSLRPDEAELVAAFLARRGVLDPPARSRLAARLAGGLRRRYGDLGAPGLTAEGYLERLANGGGA